MADAPIRKHVNIAARDSAQLELRLHWFARALAAREGYIVAVFRRTSVSGRPVARVSYELQLPRVVPAAAAARRRRIALQHAALRSRARQQAEAVSSTSL